MDDLRRELAPLGRDALEAVLLRAVQSGALSAEAALALVRGGGADGGAPAKKRVLGVIPARYGSTRFPGKPLADLGGKPMIWVRTLRAPLAPASSPPHQHRPHPLAAPTHVPVLHRAPHRVSRYQPAASACASRSTRTRTRPRRPA